MNNIEIIKQYILSGINDKQRIGLELEHFVYDDDYHVIDYECMKKCLVEMAKRENGVLIQEEDKIYGFVAKNYSVSLEPGLQLEISISPCEKISDVIVLYKHFRMIADRIFNETGFYLNTQAIFPLIENGEMKIEDMPLLPKERYRCMDQYFEHTGIYGKYMMRATASTQISIDFHSKDDALLKLRVLQKIAPIVALLTENRSGIKKEGWKTYLIRSQIWRNVDNDRCGYLDGSLNNNYSIDQYAEFIYCNSGILVEENGELIDIRGKRIEEYYSQKVIGNVDYLLSMYFPTVRMKKYIEYRVADSMKIEDAEKYMHFISKIVYDEAVLKKLDWLFGGVTSVRDIYLAEDQIFISGYDAVIYGKPVMEWIEDIFQVLLACPDESSEYIRKMVPVQLLNNVYCNHVKGNEKIHLKEDEKIKDYLNASTAKYHDRVVRTLYIPKIFTSKEIEYMSDAMNELYGIFDRVIEHYLSSADYRKLFGFEDRLEKLILQRASYTQNIPMARIDLFLNEKTRDFKFCEFNTDGASAMNEDRELNCAFQMSEAYKAFAEKYPCKSLELFDSWVEEAIKIYWEYAGEKNELPNVCIVDFLENATINEFYIFKEAFERRGCRTSICDIRKLRYESNQCFSEDGMKIDLVYRRAVTSDIMTHYDEVGSFLRAYENHSFCLVGDFRTQIVHNKILYKVLHMKQTSAFLSRKQRLFIKNHIPYTVSLDEVFADYDLSEDVFHHKDKWIIKPEDSYGSKGVYAGVELENEERWIKIVQSKQNENYILQEFCTPYRTDNIRFQNDDFAWIDTSNLTGVFVYNGKLAGIYSRISFEQMISTQYNEMAIPTIIEG